MSNEGLWTQSMSREKETVDTELLPMFDGKSDAGTNGEHNPQTDEDEEFLKAIESRVEKVRQQRMQINRLLNEKEALLLLIANLRRAKMFMERGEAGESEE